MSFQRCETPLKGISPALGIFLMHSKKTKNAAGTLQMRREVCCSIVKDLKVLHPTFSSKLSPSILILSQPPGSWRHVRHLRGSWAAAPFSLQHHNCPGLAELPKHDRWNEKALTVKSDRRPGSGIFIILDNKESASMSRPHIVTHVTPVSSQDTDVLHRREAVSGGPSGHQDR